MPVKVVGCGIQPGLLPRRDDGQREDLGVRVDERCPGALAMVFEHRDAGEPLVGEVTPARSIGPKHALDALVVHVARVQIVLGCLHDDFVPASRRCLGMEAGGGGLVGRTVAGRDRRITIADHP